MGHVFNVTKSFCLQIHSPSYGRSNDTECYVPATAAIRNDNLYGVLHNDVTEGLYNEIIDDEDLTYEIPDDANSGRSSGLRNTSVTPDNVYSEILCDQNTGLSELRHDELSSYKSCSTSSKETKSLQTNESLKENKALCLISDR